MGPELFASLMVSSIGFVASSAVSDVPLMAAIAAALLAAMWVAIRLGA